MKLNETIVAALLVSALMMMPACEEKGPLEKAGENIEDAAEDAGDAIEDATDGR